MVIFSFLLLFVLCPCDKSDLLLLLLTFILLFKATYSLSISYKEALNVFVNNSVLSLITNISIYIFGQNDLVKVLEGNGSQADFMEFVRYCDSEIAKTVNGASLGSNVSKSGSYAQSKSHEENRTEIVNSDIKYATRIATKLFKKIDVEINLNIAVEKDKELLDRAKTLEILKNLGYEMSGEQLAKEFDLPVPIKKEELKFLVKLFSLLGINRA